MSLAVVILAAGKGTRLNSEKYKVFHEIGNFPMLYHIINTAKQLNPKRIIIVISEGMKGLEKEIKKKFPKIKFCIQKRQLGTADALHSAKKYYKNEINKVLVLYGDTPLIKFITLKKLQKKLNNKSDMCVLTMKPTEPKQYGRVILNINKKVEKIIEFTEANKDEKKNNLCNSGIMIFKSFELLRYINQISNNNSKNEYFLTDIVEIFKKNKKVIDHLICEYEETLGVNDREDLLEVETNFQKVKVKEFLRRGITILDKKSVYFSYDTKIGKDSIIYPNVYFGKEVEVGINVKIKSFSHLEGATIKNNCEIGPFARIRPDSTIYDSVRIGNFVEIKKSEIKNNAKIPHLSYIGDSTVGSETNIGAGTITCNYDGVRKNKTKIGKHCFIGSNTSLIAPLSIGDNAIIGAGSIIKKNVSKSIIIYGKPKIVRKNKKN